MSASDPRPPSADANAPTNMLNRMLDAFGSAAEGAPRFSTPQVVAAIMPFHQMASNDLNAAVTLLRSIEQGRLVAPPPPDAAAASASEPPAHAPYDPFQGLAVYIYGGRHEVVAATNPQQPAETPEARRGRFDHLPQCVADGSRGKEDKCAICLETIVAGEHRTELLCSHGFHRECAWAWLKSHNTCPTCRFETL